MEKLMIFMMVLVSVLTLWVKDIEIFLMDRAYRTVQYGLEHAVHDAALQIQILPLSEGHIVFDQVKAEEVLMESIQKNIPVDSSLSPSSDLFFTQPLEILDIIYLDHHYIDMNTGLNMRFPSMWEYTLPDGETFERAIFGPSIALVVNVEAQGSGEMKPFVVIQEYKR